MIYGGTNNQPIFAWNNEASGASISSSGGTVTQSLDYALTGTTYDLATITASGSTVSITLDLGAAQECSFAAIAAHNIGSLAGDVDLQRSSDGSTWTAVDGSGSISDNNAVAFVFDPISYRYWRFSISSITSGDSLEIGTLFVGPHIEMPQRIYQGYEPPTTANRVILQSNVSEGGNLLGSASVDQGSVTEAQFQHLLPTFTRSVDWLGFKEHFSVGNGFFWAWRPLDYPDVFYAWNGGNSALQEQNTGPAAFQSVSVPMRFYDDA